MKRIMLVFVSCFLLFSCTSMPKNIEVNQVGRAAIIAMYTDTEVIWEHNQNDRTGVIDSQLLKSLNGVNYLDTQILSQNAEVKVLEVLDNKLDLLPKADVLGNSNYRLLKVTSKTDVIGDKVIEGYKTFFPRDKQKVAFILDKVGADTGIFISFKYFKYFKSRYGECSGDLYPMVAIRIQMLDKTGQKIFDEEVKGIGDEYVFCDEGEFDKEEFSYLIPKAVDKALINLKNLIL